MGERFNSLKEKTLSVVTQYLSPRVQEKAKQNLGALEAPTYREIPPNMKGNQFVTEGMRGWAYAAISAIADDVSANPYVMYQRRGKDWTAIDSHPLMDLINKPNPYQTKEEFLWLTVAYLLTVGEAMWVLDNSINPQSMVIFNPSKVMVNFSEKETIDSYKLTLSDGKHQNVPAENVVFFKLPSFQTPFRGTGVMEHIAAAVDVDNFVQDYVRVFFYNNALPNAILQSEQEIPEETGKRLLKAFEARHKGIKNSHKLAILDRGLKFQSIDKSFQELQMGEMETKIRDRILSAFRVPKSVLGIIDEVNRANAEASDRNFSKRAVMPKLRFIQAQINQYLVPKFGDGRNLWLEFENPVMEDELTKAQVRQINILSGIRTADEYRQEDGLEPIGEDQTPTQVDQNTEDTTKFLKAKVNTHINRSKVLDKREKVLSKLDAEIYEEARKFVASKSKKEEKPKNKMNTGPFLAEEVQNYHTKKVENTNKIEKDFTERVWINQKRQKKEILAQLSGKRRKKTALTISFDEEQEAAILASLSFPYIERSILAQAGLTAALLNIDNTLDTQDNRVKAFMRKWSGTLGKSNSATVQDFITRALRDWGEKEDATIADLKTTISEYFDEPGKAEMIARTETSRASGFATETVYKDAGVVAKKWASAIDERVCEFCDQLDGKIVSIEENFIDKGDSFVGRDGGVLKADYGAVPAEPSHPGCRCDILPVFDYDKAAHFSFKSLQKEMLELDSKKKALAEEEQELQKKKEEHEKEVAENLKAIDELKRHESKA